MKSDARERNVGAPWYRPPPMPEPVERRELDAAPVADDVRFDVALRPRTFAEVVGQKALVDN